MLDKRILVIGTTPDYVAHITRGYPGRALFVNHILCKMPAVAPAPDESSKVRGDLTCPEDIADKIERHLARRRMEPIGITCFDCEWLGLTAHLAVRLRLPYPSADSIRLCRNKYLSKRVWTERDVPCPRSAMVCTTDEAKRFAEKIGGAVVLKPPVGSGSELTFLCPDPFGAGQAFIRLKDGLARRKANPLFWENSTDGGFGEKHHAVLAEEYITGREYSCDIMISGGRMSIIRSARKIRAASLPFGTTLAYQVPARLPDGVDGEAFGISLFRAAESLGLSEAICMVDFIVRDNKAMFLEITPRPGGDCLPPLIRECSGHDMLGMALDFAERRPIALKPQSQWRQLAGLRLLSRREGTVRSFDLSGLSADKRVLRVSIIRSTGHEVYLPPKNYDSWVLGYVIFQPDASGTLEEECREIAAKLIVTTEPFHASDSTEYSGQNQRPVEKSHAAA
jgi:biotin carboxylase